MKNVDNSGWPNWVSIIFCRDMTIKEWDVNTLACIRTLQGHKGPVNDFKVSDRFFVSCCTDGHIRVWDREIPKTGGEDDSIRMQIIDNRTQHSQKRPKSAVSN